MTTLLTKMPMTFFSKEKALSICDANNETDSDGWAYDIVEMNGIKGYFAIRVYDEDNIFLGYL
jgi:hypothetical protein